jgi:hypothetical protein
MTVSARSEEMGEVQADIPVEAGSNPGRIAVNVKYLLEYLAGKDGLITLGNTSASSPALFHYGAKPIVAIMPMFVQWGDEQPATEPPQAESREGEPETKGENPEGQETGKQTVEKATSESEEEIHQEPTPEPVAATVATTKASAAHSRGTKKVMTGHKRGARRKKDPEA